MSGTLDQNAIRDAKLVSSTMRPVASFAVLLFANSALPSVVPKIHWLQAISTWCCAKDTLLARSPCKSVLDEYSCMHTRTHIVHIPFTLPQLHSCFVSRDKAGASAIPCPSLPTIIRLIILLVCIERNKAGASANRL